MNKFLKRLFCRHPDGLTFIRNIYGDEIMTWGYKRSCWRCNRNGCLVGKDELFFPENPQPVAGSQP
jgi:hypothetical protein